MSNFCKFLLTSVIFVVSLLGNDTNSSNMKDLLLNLEKINSQIQILNSQSDQNATTDIESLKTLNARKANLLAEIPASIVRVEIDEKDINNLEKKFKKQEKILANIAKSKNNQAYLKNAILLQNFRENKIFYQNIFLLKRLFEDRAPLDEIKTLLENALIDVNSNIYPELKSLDSLGNFQAEIGKLELYEQSLDDVLFYLKENAELLRSSFILNGFNLTSIIEYINLKSPISLSGFNLGKTIVIVFIFLFFVSLTRLLAKLTYWVALSLFAKNSNAQALKDQIVQIIKNPISALLITYALKICVGVAYYPSPISLDIVNFFVIAYIIGFSWLVVTMLNGYGMLFISELAKKSGRKEIVNLVLKIVYFIVFVITLLMILSRLGFDISAIIASLGIGGLAVAFAAKDIIANFFASVMLLFDNSFSQGDWIVCGDIEGTIVEIGLRKTTIRSFDNALIFVPNSFLASEAIQNWSRRRVGRMISLTVGVTYDSSSNNIKKCIEDIKQMLVEHKYIANAQNIGNFKGSEKRFKYRQNIVSIDDLAGYKNDMYVALDALNSSSIDISIICFAKPITKSEFIEVKEDVIFKIIDIVERNHLSFAFPSKTLYVENSSSDKAFLLDRKFYKSKQKDVK